MSKETENFFVEQALILSKERRQITLQEIKNKEKIYLNCEGGAAALTNFVYAETATSKPSQFTYFYQSADGQNAYLHPINFKMIEELYGNWENFPLTLNGKILQKEYFFMNDDLKKRFKYLEHLPITSEFTIIEIDFTDPKMPPGILHRFHGKLKRYL